MWWLLAVAHADSGFGEPPPPKPTGPIAVTDPASEGLVNLSMPGHDGDTVSVDGWKLGVLPLQTTLAEGLHEFRVEGPSGTLTVQTAVAPRRDRAVDVVLTVPAPAPAPKPTPDT